jgi:HSP20 family protein
MAIRDLVRRRERNTANSVPARRPESADPFTAIHDEFDRLLERLMPDFFRGGVPAPRTWESGWDFLPEVDVTETSKEVKVTADLPGVSEKDLDIRLEDGRLVLRGEKREEKDTDEQGRRHSERFYGRFERAIPLEHDVDADKVKATYRNGVLEVRLPKVETEEEKSRKINVVSG